MSKKLLTTVLATMLVLALALSVTGCGSNNPKGVVTAFFESIDKADATKFLNCFDKDTKDQILDGIDKSDLKDQLQTLDDYFTDQYGKNWKSKIKIKNAEKGDTEDGVTYYSVPVVMEDEEDEIQVMKVKGNYYIDSSAMGSLMGGN